MADREKVIKGMAVCIADLFSRGTCKLAKCPYACIEDQGMQHYECRKTLLKDALELLKEQQSAYERGKRDGVSQYLREREEDEEYEY